MHLANKKTLLVVASAFLSILGTTTPQPSKKKIGTKTLKKEDLLKERTKKTFGPTLGPRRGPGDAHLEVLDAITWGSSQDQGSSFRGKMCKRRTRGSLITINISYETELKSLSKFIGPLRSSPPRRAIFYKTVARSLGNRARAWLCALFRAPEATTGAAPVVPPLIWRVRRTQGVRCVHHAGLEAVWSSSYCSVLCSCVLALSLCVCFV